MPTPERIASASPEFLRKVNVELKKLLVDCTYTGRGHQQAGQRWSTINMFLGIPSQIISAILGVGAAGSALVGDRWITAGLAITSVIFATLNDFLKPREASESHLAKGHEYITLRNKTRLFRELSLTRGMSVEHITDKLEDLRSQYALLGTKPPRNIPGWAYQAAKKSIAKGESSYQDDPLWKELDKE